jgi:hypothetical protein
MKHGKQKGSGSKKLNTAGTADSIFKLSLHCVNFCQSPLLLPFLIVGSNTGLS